MRAAAVFILFIALSYVYLVPGSTALFEGRTDLVLSDDTDPAAVPYLYALVLKTWQESPSRLFYGSILVDGWDPSQGHAVWMPWCERWLVVIGSYFIPLEQISTFMILILLVANGLAMYGLARYLKWNQWVAIGLGIAWAFCAFTRARAKVHGSMAAQFHLPLIFLSLYLIVRGRSWKSIAAAALGLLAACTVVHYFLVTILFLSPFFLIFAAIQPETRANWKLVAKRFVLAVLPAILFLGFNFAVPTPPGATTAIGDAMPRSGEMPDGSLHPFLSIYAARPIDYFTGDIALQAQPSEINPLRQFVNIHILTNLGDSNPHERTNGVRWSIWLFAILALIGVKKAANKREVAFFAVFGLFGLWLSLAPLGAAPELSPSLWLNALVSQIRVPSRAGILVNFSLLMLAGFWLASTQKGFQHKLQKWILLPAVFPVLMIADYPPLVQNMPMARMRPVYRELQPDRGACGAGFYIPFVSNSFGSVLYYYGLQQLRGPPCQVLNSMDSPARIEHMTLKFPAAMNFLESLDRNMVVDDQISRLAKCVPLSWIAFDPHTPQTWRERMCALLGWKMYPDLTCIAPDKGRRLEKLPDECI